MKKNYDFSVIIPYYHGRDNLMLLKDGLSKLYKYPRVEIIVVEIGLTPTINFDDIAGKYYFLKSDVFNLAWAHNYGSKMATTDHLVFGEFNMKVNLEVMVSTYRNSNATECVILQNMLYNVSVEENRSNKIDESRGSKAKYLCDGWIMISRDSLNKIGGWDENMVGQDLYHFQTIKMNKMLKMTQVENVTTFRYDLENPYVYRELDVDSSAKLLGKLMKQDDTKLMRYIRVQYEKFAKKNKYVQPYHNKELYKIE